MTIPSTGIIGLSDVREEVYGVGYSTLRGLSNCVADADPSVGSAPIGISAFRGHTQSWGRVYGREDISFDAWAASPLEGILPFGGGDTLLWTASANEDVSIYKSAAYANIVASDGIRVEIYYRTKQTSGSWTLLIGWNNYATATYSPHSLSSTLYDYRFVITNNI